MDLLGSLREEQRSPRLYRLRFASAVLEQEFRDWQRRRHAIARVSLFLVLALGFALTAPFDARLFAAPAAGLPRLQLLQWGLMVPFALLGALVSALRMPARRQRALQTLAVMGIWGGALASHGLALHEGYSLPGALFGIAVIAVAFFGGFTWQRILLGVCLFTTAAIVVEYRLQDADAGLQSFTLILFGVVAVAGSYTHEILSRLAWLNWRYARELAATDGLTGLSNHYEFHRLFQRVLAQAARDERPIAVGLLDLDHFKSVNDRYGHLFGDRVLRAVGELLNVQVARRPLDLRARYGGEEMAIVWYDVQPESLPALMEEVLDAIRTLPLTDPASGLRVRITASAGLCWLVPAETTTAEEVLHAADLLLYGAKADGRNRARLAPFADCAPVAALPLAAAIRAQAAQRR